MAQPSVQIFNDIFLRANSATVGLNWLQAGSGSPFSILSNALNVTGSGTSDASNTACWITRPVGASVPTTLITGTNEASINQRVVIVVPNLTTSGGTIVLRANTTNTKGYILDYCQGFVGTVLAGVVSAFSIANLGNGSSSFGPTVSSADPFIVDFSAVSTDSTHTQLLVIYTHIPTGIVTLTSSIALNSTATLQSGDAGIVTCGLTAVAAFSTGGGAAWNILAFTSYTDQAVAVASTLVPAVLNSAFTATENSLALTVTTPPSGGTPTLGSQWFRSTTINDPTHGKPLLGQASTTGFTDLGLRCATTHYYTLATFDQTVNNPQLVYSNTIAATTSAGIESNNPGLRSSLIHWFDADSLVGQTNGSALVGPAGQFTVGAKSTSFAPIYNANSMPNNKASIGFNGTSQALLIEPADVNAGVIGSFLHDYELYSAFGTSAGSFTITAVFNFPSPASIGTMLGNWTGISSPTGVDTSILGFCSNARGGALYSVQNYDGTFDSIASGAPGYLMASDTTFNESGVALTQCPVAIFSASYNASTRVMTYACNDGTIFSYTLPSAKLLSFLRTISIGMMIAKGAGVVGGNFPLHFNLSQLLIDNVALTVAQQKSDQAYFRSRYGFTNNGKYSVQSVGDSRTAGTGSTGGLTYPAQLQTDLGSTALVFNRGWISASTGPILGQYSYGWQASMCPSVLRDDPSKPQIAVLWCSVNDWYHNTNTEATAFNNFTTAVTQLTAFNFTGSTTVGSITYSASQFINKIVVCTDIDANPTGGTNNGEVSWDAFRNPLNTSLRTAFTSNVNVVICDLAVVAGIGPDGSSGNSNFSGDFLHPSNAGYTIVAATVAGIIFGMLPSSVSSRRSPNTTGRIGSRSVA